MAYRPPPFAAAFAFALALGLTACGGRDRPPSDAEAAAAGESLAPLPASFTGTWQGVLPCADCAGIEVEIELARETGALGRYRLVERYLGDVEALDFEVAGEWRERACGLEAQSGSCIELVESAQRWFRHEDGSLQAVDAEGRPLDADGARLLRR